MLYAGYSAHVSLAADQSEFGAASQLHEDYYGKISLLVSSSFRVILFGKLSDLSELILRKVEPNHNVITVSVHVSSPISNR